MNRNHFQLVMLAYHLNCWLMLFNRDEDAKVETLQHTTLATARLRFLFLAAKIWRRSMAYAYQQTAPPAVIVLGLAVVAIGLYGGREGLEAFRTGTPVHMPSKPDMEDGRRSASQG